VEKESRRPWSIVSSRGIYDYRWISVTHHAVVAPDVAGGPS
jgi:hypothetical protein